MTGNPRVFIWIALALVLWLNWEAWMRDYAPPTPPTPAASTQSGQAKTPTLGESIPQASTPSAASGADKTPAPATGSAPASPPGQQVEAANGVPSGGSVHVRTDVLDLDINLQGGTFERADLLKYPKVKGGAELVRLMNTNPDTLYLLQTGLTGPADSARPNHLATFHSAQSDYRLGNAQELRVPLTWVDDAGVTVTKTFIFKPGSYRIDLEERVDNKSAAPWQAASYAQILRRDPVTKRTLFTTNVENYAFHGPAIYDGTKYRKLKITDEDDRTLNIPVTNGWIASLQHHFVGAVVPPKDVEYRFTLRAEGQEYRLAAAGPMVTIAPGQSQTFTQTLFVGPKLQAQLEKAGPELQLVADYGKLTLLAKPLFIVLSWVHNLLGNWGWAIVIVTFLLKLLFYPLSETSGRSMAKMKLLSPRIKALQETYKDDREKLGRAMMDLYKREKVNPVAGCLPMLIQIPVFLAFYWVLLESVEMRQAPFVGWINDLSSRDPFFVLPAIMAAAMFAQYKLQGTPGADPVQQKVFMFMPFVMSFMFAFFPAGLVLYWVTNTLLSIAQQWNINRRIKASAKKT
ncbi:MAG TPA: membrane protein insertase YidC [Steroidobacteraceae bacterium]|jgi:YidC/Oxa1 family membrane protein insertase|nr:membrane protein insertase YidC [Steroidobacteraceae bacterium]